MSRRLWKGLSLPRSPVKQFSCSGEQSQTEVKPWSCLESGTPEVSSFPHGPERNSSSAFDWERTNASGRVRTEPGLTTADRTRCSDRERSCACEVCGEIRVLKVFPTGSSNQKQRGRKKKKTEEVQVSMLLRGSFLFQRSVLFYSVLFGSVCSCDMTLLDYSVFSH